MPRTPAQLTTPFAIISIVTVLTAAIPGVLLEPNDYDGAAQIIAIFVIPGLSATVLTGLASRTLTVEGPIPAPLLWWSLVVLPVGVVLGLIPAILQDRGYFSAENPASFILTLIIMLLLVVIAMLIGAVTWGLLVQPIVKLIQLLRSRQRGEPVPSKYLVAPLMFLGVAAIIFIGVASLDDLLPGRMAGGQIIKALLGIPGSFEVTWPLGLWIVRALVLVCLVTWFFHWRSERRNRPTRHTQHNPRKRPTKTARRRAAAQQRNRKVRR